LKINGTLPQGLSDDQDIVFHDGENDGRPGTNANILILPNAAGAVLPRRGCQAECRQSQTTMVVLIALVCDHIRRSMQFDAVVLCGGVFMNARLSSEAITRLKDDGFRSCRRRLVHPSDGGSCLAQLAIAAAPARGESDCGRRGPGKAPPDTR
jgi:Carbamoyltransferase, Kae1-like Domain, second subdomain